MRQHVFERLHEAEWRGLESMLKPRLGPSGDLPQLYRAVCQHLAIAQQLQYAPSLIDRLNQLVLQGHQRLYGARAGNQASIARYLNYDFPCLVRAEWRVVLVAVLLLFGPAILLTLLVCWKPHLAASILDQQMLHRMETMYRPDAAHFGRERGGDSDFLMFGFYIKNNIGIDFQCFASGILLGLGSVYFLVYNGVYFGVIAGYLTQLGYGSTFWPFVVGHGSFELTAAAIAGAAGLKLGAALLAPGRQSRRLALVGASRTAVRLLYGAAAMTFFAAFFEAFWSSRVDISPEVKFAVAGCLWTLVICYFLFVGRGRVRQHAH